MSDSLRKMKARMAAIKLALDPGDLCDITEFKALNEYHFLKQKVEKAERRRATPGKETP